MFVETVLNKAEQNVTQAQLSLNENNLKDRFVFHSLKVILNLTNLMHLLPHLILGD